MNFMGGTRMIDFVNLSNMQNFTGNPIVEQHRLRFETITKRQGWDVPNYKGLEFDQYDNPAAKYLVYRDKNGVAQGSSRFYPTTLPYMLETTFSNYVTEIEMPKSDAVWEGSRFCINNALPAAERKKIMNHIVVGYLEAGLQEGIEAIVGIMYPAYWRGIFIQAGWPIEFIGETLLLEDGYKARAAWLPISEDILLKVREKTAISEPVLNFVGNEEIKHRKAA